MLELTHTGLQNGGIYLKFSVEHVISLKNFFDKENKNILFVENLEKGKEENNHWQSRENLS